MKKIKMLFSTSLIAAVLTCSTSLVQADTCGTDSCGTAYENTCCAPQISPYVAVGAVVVVAAVTVILTNGSHHHHHHSHSHG